MLDQFATGGNMTGQVSYQSADGIDVLLPLFFGQEWTYLCFEFLHRSTCIGEERAVSPPGHLRSLDDVMFVFDLADDLLQQVLDRDEAVDATELIHHQSQMTALQTHLEQEVEHLHGGSDKFGRPEDVGQ